MRALVLVALVACGGSKPPAKIVDDKPAPVALDPACPYTTTINVAGGKLRCRELPITADFPPGLELERQDSENLTFIRASMERGVLALFVEPRFGATEDNLDGLKARLQALVRGVAEDAVITEAAAPPQTGATASAGISFKTPDGGMGLVYGYLAHGWFVAGIAGGRVEGNAARPDQPAGKAFLASLKVRPTADTWEPRQVLDGVTLDLPVAAWEQKVDTDAAAGSVAARMYSAVAERAWIVVREVDKSPGCTLFDNMTDADVPALVKKMFGSEQIEVTGKIVKPALYASLVAPNKTLAINLICRSDRVVLVTVTATRPVAELDALIARITKRIRP